MGNGQKKCTVHIFFTEQSLKTKLSASSSLSLGDLRQAIHDKVAAHMAEITLWKEADMDEHLNQSLESIILSADRHGSNSFDSANDTTLLKDLSPAMTSGSVLYAIIPSLLKPNLRLPPAATDWVRDADTLSSPVHDFLECVVEVGSKDRKAAKAAKQKAENAEDSVTKMLKRLDQEANERQEAKWQWEQQRQEMKRQQEAWEAEKKEWSKRQQEEAKRRQEELEAEKKELKEAWDAEKKAEKKELKEAWDAEKKAEKKELKEAWDAEKKAEKKELKEAWEAKEKELKDRISVLEVGSVDMVEWLVHEDTQALDRIKLRSRNVDV